MKALTRSKFVWLAGAVFVATAGTMAVAAPDAPVPPAPPTPPAPPAPPESKQTENRVVIVEKHGGSDGKDYVRTITRDGKTFVFETDRQLSDDEVERRIADAETRLPPVPPVPPAADGSQRRVIKQRVIVMNDRDEAVTDVVTEESDRCQGKASVADVDSSAENDGKLTRVRVRVCGAPTGLEKHAMAEAINGIRQARDEIAGDKSLSESIRRKILNNLDAEIARLSS